MVLHATVADVGKYSLDCLRLCVCVIWPESIFAIRLNKERNGESLSRYAGKPESTRARKGVATVTCWLLAVNPCSHVNNSSITVQAFRRRNFLRSQFE